MLVTGGAGFVGSHLCELLVSRGDTVHVFDDLSRGFRDWLPPEVELHRGDVRNEDSIRAVFETLRPDVVVHLAALHFIPAVDGAPDVAEEINVKGTRNLVAAARVTPPRVVLFSSTGAVYPSVEGPIPESLPAAPIDLYGRTKLAGERLLADLSAECGVACVSARLFNVIGPRETNPHVVPQIVEQVRSGVLELALGNLEPRRDYIDVRDVAEALTLLLEHAPPGSTAYNVGSGIGVSVAELVSVCERIVGHALSVRRDPERIRPVERPALIADVRAIESMVGWRSRRDLIHTLRELIGDAPTNREGVLAL